jgi:putative SOS response-associated peptidase YedK
MCGRYSLDGSDPRSRALHQALDWMSAAIAPESAKYWSFDARPTTRRAVFFQDSGKSIALAGARWGWERAFLGKRPVINARFETVDAKKMFAQAMRERRCVVPATAYFEWRRDAKDRPLAKFAFREADGHLLLLAGLWEDVEIEGGSERRFLVLTRAMERYAEIHDRTPVLLSRDAAEAWLDPQAQQAEVTQAAGSRTDDDLVVRSVVSGPSKTVPEDERLVAPIDQPWPWQVSDAS